ncbi:MAG: 50S ribosomal protein L16 [Alphaproteobacteria bacterium]|nr:50S ribosomal protein L16 [Alphaproteobacteria bacterium]
MMSPARTKYRKAHKGRIKGTSKGATSLTFGSYGLKAVQPERVTARQIEAARRAITRHLKRSGRLWIRVFPDVPVSTKPAEVRMGSGKGAPEFWVCRVKPGRILFEVDGVPRELAARAFELAAAKLPIKTRFVARLGLEG